jgi:hypothetical protein
MRSKGSRRAVFAMAEVRCLRTCAAMARRRDTSWHLRSPWLPALVFFLFPLSLSLSLSHSFTSASLVTFAKRCT